MMLYNINMINHEIGQSKEDYLEAIAMIRKEKGSCLSIDVANRLNYSRPSVSIAVKNLEAEHYITRNQNGELELTKKGHAVADRIVERHFLLTSIFKTLGISAETAEKDACRIEHFLSDETFDCIKDTLQKFKEKD